jgi:type II secretory pathway component PulC
MFSATHCFDVVHPGPPGGIRIEAIRPGSIFEEAGLCNGDEILSIAGIPIDGARSEVEAMTALEHADGRSISVEIRRRGQTHHIALDPGYQTR